MDEEEVKGEIRNQGENDEITEDLAVLDIVNSIQKGHTSAVGRVRGEQTPNIYRVPKVLRQANEKCYEPQLSSVGPYHHGKEELKPMEEVKFQHLQALLARNPNLELKDYVREIRALEEQARECYSESIRMGSNEFVGMMVVDGCFLVEMLIRICITRSQYQLWVPYFVSHDMLLLENQLPFCILKLIFSLVAPQQEATLINDLVLYCFRLIPLMRLNDGADQDEGRESNYHHVLALFHHHCLPHPTSGGASVEDDSSVFSSTKRCFLALARAIRKGVSYVKVKRLLNPVTDPPTNPFKIRIPEMSSSSSQHGSGMSLRVIKNPSVSDPPTKPFAIRIPEMPSRSQPTTLSSIRSAEELQDAGIEFKRKEGKPEGSFLDIKFQRNGVIEIPYFYFSDNLHSIFQNFIAYEQCHPKAPTFFTGYASFMDDIINTAKDVQILRHSGILEHGLGSDEELAGLFNQMNKGVLTDPERTHLYEECKAINDFCATRFHAWRANLMRNYFYSPWAILSLAAALLLVLLTVTQTVFSIYPNV